MFKHYWEILHHRLLLIAFVALIITTPAMLSAYLHTWVKLVQTDSHNFSDWIVVFTTETVNVFLLFVHAKPVPSKALKDFELSLPLGKSPRLILSFLESLLVQVPSIILLLISCAAEFEAFGRGIEINSFFQLFFAFVLLIFLNHFFLIFIKQVSLPSFFNGRTFPVQKIDYSKTRRKFITGLKLEKLFLLFKNRRRQFILGGLVLGILSYIGWRISLIPSFEQPKCFVWITLYGLTLIGCAPLSSTLKILDEECEVFLLSLPYSLEQHQAQNRNTFFYLLIPFTIELAIWPVIAHYQTPGLKGYGWKTSFSLVCWGLLLMVIVPYLSAKLKKWFVPIFTLILLIVALAAECFYL